MSTAVIDTALAHRHLLALARGDGYYELRTLQRQTDDRMAAGPSYWLPVSNGTPHRVDQAIQWADTQYHRNGYELFVGYNPRIATGGKSKDDVGAVVACYQDLDLHDETGARVAAACEALLALSHPPGLIVASGRGAHPIWPIRPTADKARWLQVQQGLALALADWESDRAVLTDEARVLRLVPFPNCKGGKARPTAILHQSDVVYTLDQLLTAYPAPAAPAPRNGHSVHSTRATVPKGLVEYAEAGQAEGKRNACGFWLACRLVEEVADEAAGRAILELYGRRCSPALPVGEVDTIWESAHKTTSYDPSKARQAPPPPAGTYHAGSPPAAPPGPPTDAQVTPRDADGEHRTDLGNAARLVRLHGDDLRYARGLGWMVYEGGRWSRDTTGGAMRAAKATVRGMYQEASEIADDRDRAAFAKWALQSESAGRLAAMLTLAESERAVACSTDDFDADPYLLNCTNGTLDLRSGELHPHDRADLITKQAPVAYDPEAQCPSWRAFLARIFEPVPDVISFLQRAIGYALTGDTSEQVMFLLYGTGANGKSTLLQTLAAVLGDYAQATPAATLMVRDRNNNATNDLARMAGARLVTAIESDEGKRLAEGLIKQMTGGDKIVARYLHQEFFEFTPQFKLFLATNHKPIIRGTDYAIWRRIHLVPFLVTIPEEERDPYMAQRLGAEAPGILAWAVEGYQQIRLSRLEPPPSVTGATSDYRAEMDLIAAFLEECCAVERTMMVAAGALYAAYKAWAEESGERPITQRTFSLRLQERGHHTERRGAGSKPHWMGLGLFSHAE